MKMIIKQHLSSKTMKLEEFADKHGLDLHMNERGPDLRSTFNLCRWYCSFPSFEIVEDGVLIGCSGNGETHEEAIKDYCDQISGKEAKINAFSPDCRKVQIPTLIP